jgi:hypothetical protein
MRPLKKGISHGQESANNGIQSSDACVELVKKLRSNRNSLEMPSEIGAAALAQHHE